MDIVGLSEIRPGIEEISAHYWSGQKNAAYLWEVVVAISSLLQSSFIAIVLVD